LSLRKLLLLIFLLCLIGTTSTASAWTDSEGYKYQRYLKISLAEPIAEHAQYKIVINGQTIEIYNVTDDLEITGDAGEFWNYVSPGGEDIRVFDQNGLEQYFYLESWDYQNKTATMWVNLTADISEFNIAYGNPTATNSSTYENVKQVFKIHDDFNDGIIDTDLFTVIDSAIEVNGELVVESYPTNTNPIGVKLNMQINPVKDKYVIEVLGSIKYDTTGYAEDWHSVMQIEYDANNYFGVRYRSEDSGGAIIAFSKTEAGTTTVITDTATYTKGTGYDEKIIIDAGTIKEYRKLTTDKTYDLYGQSTYSTNTLHSVYLIYKEDGLPDSNHALKAAINEVRVYSATDPANFISIIDVAETESNDTYIAVPDFFVKISKPFLILFDLPFFEQDRKELLLPTTTSGYELYNYLLQNTTDKEELYAILYELNATEIEAHLLTYNDKTEYGQFYVENDLNSGKSKLIFTPGEQLTASKFKIRLISNPVWWEKILWRFGFLPSLEVGG